MSTSTAVQPAAAAPASAWTEPPWSGWIETTGDALLILEAARRGLIPRVTRRLVDSERKMITSGSVFVFDEDESGIKRWTDGFFWSPSRILGNFLLYRETDKRGAGHRGARSDMHHPTATDEYNADGTRVDGQTLSRPKGESSEMGIDRHRERTLMGSLTNSYKFKPEGLMKKVCYVALVAFWHSMNLFVQTFSLTIGGVAQHLISYYKIEDVENGRLRCPSSLPELACLDISPEYLDKEHFRNPPKVEFGPDGLPRYRGEADIEENSPELSGAALSSGIPTLKSVHDASGTKRSKRFDPYGTSGSSSKRTRKSKSAQKATTPPPADVPLASASSQGVPQTGPPPVYAADPNVHAMGHSHYAPYPVPYYQIPPYPPHMYPQSYPAPTASVSPPNPSPQTSSPPQQQSQPQPPQYTMAYPAQPSASEPQQIAPPPQAQQSYPSYYYSASHAYHGYSGTAWSYGYAGPQAGASSSAAQPSPPELEDKGPADGRETSA
ncbi:hypothetical protein HWV62_20526 [Athelia sp. TMB]|nr:hypothetical protein HWV62_20526 [Athelia sp. TMB]